MRERARARARSRALLVSCVCRDRTEETGGCVPLSLGVPRGGGLESVRGPVQSGAHRVCDSPRVLVCARLPRARARWTLLVSCCMGRGSCDWFIKHRSPAVHLDGRGR